MRKKKPKADRLSIDSPKLRRRLETSGYLKGLRGEDLEDCVQEVLCRMLEGRHQKATCDQAVLDFIRKDQGDVRRPNHEKIKACKRPMHQLEEIALTPQVPYTKSNSDHLILLHQLKEKIKARNDDQITRAIMLLFYFWGLTQREIAEVFGLSETRIYQIISLSRFGLVPHAEC